MKNTVISAKISELHEKNTQPKNLNTDLTKFLDSSHVYWKTLKKHWKTFIATVCQYNTSNLSTECIQNQFLFLKDCTSKHVGPIVSYKGF